MTRGRPRKNEWDKKTRMTITVSPRTRKQFKKVVGEPFSTFLEKQMKKAIKQKLGGGKRG